MNERVRVRFDELEIQPEGLEEYGWQLLLTQQRIKKIVSTYSHRLSSRSLFGFVPLPIFSEEDERQKYKIDDVAFDRDLIRTIKQGISGNNHKLTLPQKESYVRWTSSVALLELAREVKLKKNPMAIESIALSARRNFLSAISTSQTFQNSIIDPQWVRDVSCGLLSIGCIDEVAFKKQLETFVNNPPVI